MKAFGSTLAAESGNGRRKRRGRRKGQKMSAAGRRAIAEAQQKDGRKFMRRRKPRSLAKRDPRQKGTPGDGNVDGTTIIAAIGTARIRCSELKFKRQLD